MLGGGDGTPKEGLDIVIPYFSGSMWIFGVPN